MQPDPSATLPTAGGRILVKIISCYDCYDEARKITKLPDGYNVKNGNCVVCGKFVGVLEDE